MASFWSFWAMLLALLGYNCSSALVCIISAAPASAPLVSPTQSPDSEPVFPTTPAKGGFSHSPSFQIAVRITHCGRNIAVAATSATASHRNCVVNLNHSFFRIATVMRPQHQQKIIENEKNGSKSSSSGDLIGDTATAPHPPPPPALGAAVPPPRPPSFQRPGSGSGSICRCGRFLCGEIGKR
ncbi:hypothetical protein Fmac_006655 [Flemingia macrophylla]|uniref:Secreted protein n=1 Tax=Flemingia macrophylla TaxID=520843 RepID=A0ABD1NB86_9FABA